MRDEPLGDLAATFALLSLIAIGGANAVMPDIERQSVEVHRWLTPQGFADLFALAQAAPGPNVMIASLVGYHVAGLAGLLVATLAICGPSCLLAYGLAGVVQRYRASPWLKAVRSGLAPLAVGLIAASGLVMARSVDRDLLHGLVTVATAGFTIWTTRNPLWALAAGGAAAGIAAAL
ncbi:MAG TPA: chromate transporter [Beijerinckiaceae bacterium]|jgi:chromate transporter